MSATEEPRVAVRHPLDPLGAEEIRAAVAAVRASHPELERPSFSLVVLVDPPKEAVVGHRPGDAIERTARVVVTDRAHRRTYEALVALAASGEVIAWRELEGVWPPILAEDFARAAQAALADERFVAGLRRRGIDDLDQVQVDPLSAGHFPQNPPGRRIVWATPYLKPTPLSNAYSSPIEHLRAAVDLDSGEVLEVIDDDPIVPISTADGDYETEEAVGGWRTDVAPLDIVQPDGPGFTLDGNEISWQGWRLHAALHPVDGLVLSDVRFRDGDEDRRILYRASLSEMVVPYGDPHDGFYWRTYFDAGEYGMGRLANSLQLGCDCLGEIRYLDATLTDGAGEPYALPNAICIHEEDAGILWKHTDPASGRAHVRRARKLVVSFIATVGNYDYGFYWSLHQDGTIELEAKLTGIVLTRGVTPGQELQSATRIAPDLAAPHHQHLFCMRLDMAVDGFANTVQEVDLVAPDAGPDNPWSQAIVTRVTPIRRESEGRRQIDPAAARTWKVVNPHRRNHVGEPTAYRLQPFNGPTMLASPDSSVGRRAGFAHAALWVTRYHPEELHAAGEHPNQHAGGAGLPAWTARDRALEDTDVVLWHTFGVSHAVRIEDWPVMPVERIGFALRPVGFFARNPAIDVPPSEPRHCHHAVGADEGATHDHRSARSHLHEGR
jgi:primary-amine oxidase